MSTLAGYVDAIGFLHLGGLFVSFMSGNSTRMGGCADQGRLTRRGGADWPPALRPGLEPFAGGGAGGGFLVRCGGLSLDQSRRDLVCAAGALALSAIVAVTAHR